MKNFWKHAFADVCLVSLICQLFIGLPGNILGITILSAFNNGLQLAWLCGLLFTGICYLFSDRDDRMKLDLSLKLKSFVRWFMSTTLMSLVFLTLAAMELPTLAGFVATIYLIMQAVVIYKAVRYSICMFKYGFEFTEQ